MTPERRKQLAKEFETKYGPKPDFPYQSLYEWTPADRWEDLLSGWILAHSDSEMSKDAERYRFIRAQHASTMAGTFHLRHGVHADPVEVDLDTAIDTAIKDTDGR